MTDVMSRVDAPAELRMVPYTYLRMFGRQPDVLSAAPGGLTLLADPSAALAVTVPWGAAVAGSARDDGVLELRSRNRPTEGLTLRPDRWTTSDAPSWARPAIRVATRLRAAGLGIGGATLVVHTGLPDSLAIPTAAATTAATTSAFIELYQLPRPAAMAAVASSIIVADRAADLAALTARPGEAVLARADTTADRLPCDLPSHGLRLLVVEPGTPTGQQPGPDPETPDGVAEQAATALRDGHPALLGPLMTAAAPALTAASVAATAAGALGAVTIGTPARPALCLLLHATDLARVRAAIRTALPTTHRPRFLTATPTGAA
ncbi:hypothetical protein [Actinoplanes derwentensis]|uniref:Galactokinase n=1 Tax=Actinoplanes derwentensis TaxID=113562 RepID=A0A1H1Y637_9ACTN|nr:hypothetical protein [Actinoplanes derwentensis]GID86704.1 hypothetical protein Ade03nite_56280 [Actinoplanes derwentensis]SDT16978.1 galactokinase [Actinoplanes derwentensis]